MFHDEADDLGSTVIKQQVANRSELAPRVGGDYGPPDYISCALCHKWQLLEGCTHDPRPVFTSDVGCYGPINASDHPSIPVAFVTYAPGTCRSSSFCGVTGSRTITGTSTAASTP